MRLLCMQLIGSGDAKDSVKPRILFVNVAVTAMGFVQNPVDDDRFDFIIQNDLCPNSRHNCTVVG
jgi:hypothetical protein